MKSSFKKSIFAFSLILVISASLFFVFDPFNLFGNNDDDYRPNAPVPWHFPLNSSDYPEVPEGYESTNWEIVEPGDIPIENPLKGFVPDELNWEPFPHSLEFTYIPANEIVGDSSTEFDFSMIEDFLERVSSRGHQGIFRIYFDFPDKECAVPEYLIDDGLTMNEYTEFGGGYNPNYDDSRMIELMSNLIDALGEEFDGDARLGFIQIGLLGHWGEWHTWPDDYLFASESTQHIVLEHFDNAFNTTMILARYPTPITAQYNVGFHDDSFAYETLGPYEWDFYPRMESSGTTNRWETAPIGGEVRPEIQIDVFREDIGDAENITECINITHASWMYEKEIFNEEDGEFTLSDSEREQAAYVSTQLGYTFAACYSNITVDSLTDELNLSVVIHNFGVAPFYYNWSVEFGIIDANNATIQSEMTDITIDGIMPGESVVWNYNWSDISTYNSNNSISLRIPNRMTGGEPVRLANKNMTANGWLKISNLDSII